MSNKSTRGRLGFDIDTLQSMDMGDDVLKQCRALVINVTLRLDVESVEDQTSYSGDERNL
jgi:hypothetical protein